jgi:hypothetical protein
MSNIDERIRRTLSTEDQVFLAELDTGDSLYREVMAAFRGRRRWLNALGWLVGLGLFIGAAYCGWRAYFQPEVRGVLLWGAGCVFAVTGLGLLKIWFWLELQANAILREIKRVEIQVASLAAERRADRAQ